MVNWLLLSFFFFSYLHDAMLLFSSHFIFKTLLLNASAAARSVDWKSIVFSPRSKIFVSFGDERVPLSHNFNILLSHFPQMTISEKLTLNPAQDVQCFQSDNLTIWHPSWSFWFCVLKFVHIFAFASYSQCPTHPSVCVQLVRYLKKKSPCKYL